MFARHSHGHRHKCKECYSVSSKLYREKNKEYLQIKSSIYYQKHKVEVNKERKEYFASYREANREACRSRSAAWKEDNRERKAFTDKRWNENNKDRNCAKASRYRAKKMSATPAWANHKYIELFYKGAKIEEERTGRKVHVDHIVPLNSPIVCGLHCEDNLQLLFMEANCSKGNRYQ